MKHLLIAAFLLLTTSMGWADHSDNEHGYKAREVVEHGEAVAYSELSAAVRRLFYGRIIRVELDRDDGEWCYRLRLLIDDGRIIEVEMDAKTLTVVEVEGKTLETAIRLTR